MFVNPDAGGNLQRQRAINCELVILEMALEWRSCSRTSSSNTRSIRGCDGGE
jgi:hypothetical protein